MFCSFLVNAQSSNELLFFNSSGHVMLIRGDNNIKQIQGESFRPNDILEIINGNVTIINLNNKKITIDKPGSYNYDDALTSMQHAESSLSNRYFVYVWKKINVEDKQKNHPGGVIRGDEFETSPGDSIIVLSDTIRFFINNISGSDFNLIIKSENYKTIKQNTIRKNLTLNIHDINDGQPGKYYWGIETPFSNSKDKKHFIIPDMETKIRLIEEYDKNILEFSSFDIELRQLLIKEYLTQNKIYY